MELHKLSVLFLTATLIAIGNCYPAQDSSESFELTEKKEDVDTVLVLPGSNAFGIRPIRPIQPIFGIPDLDDDSFEGIPSPGYFNPFRFNPFEGFVANMQSMMNMLREQMAMILTSRIRGGFFPWTGKIPEGANKTSTTKIIDGHVVTINETSFFDGDDNNQTVIRVRTIDIKPLIDDLTTTTTETTNEPVTVTQVTPIIDTKEETTTTTTTTTTTISPRSTESFEDDNNNNEIPKGQVDNLSA